MIKCFQAWVQRIEKGGEGKRIGDYGPHTEIHLGKKEDRFGPVRERCHANLEITGGMISALPTIQC